MKNPTMYRTEGNDTNNQTIFYYGDTKEGKSLQVVCDYFRGDLENFEVAMLETYRDNTLYREHYLNEIRKVKVLFELEEN